jgi:hypothetical protein
MRKTGGKIGRVREEGKGEMGKGGKERKGMVDLSRLWPPPYAFWHCHNFSLIY